MTRYQIIYWRDIPVHLRVRQGARRLSCALPSRFQKTVYRAAYRDKAITGVDYASDWQPSEWSERTEEPEAVLRILTSELETAYPDERLDRLARNKGYESDDN